MLTIAPPVGCSAMMQPGVLAADKRADGVDLEESPHVVGRDGVERRRRPDGGIVDEQVEPAEVAAGAVDHRARRVFVAELGAEGGGFVARLRSVRRPAAVARSSDWLA